MGINSFSADTNFRRRLLLSCLIHWEVVKGRPHLNCFKIQNPIKLVYVYLANFFCIKLVHFWAKLGFFRAQKVVIHLIEGAIFSNFFFGHCLIGKLRMVFMPLIYVKKIYLCSFFETLSKNELSCQKMHKKRHFSSPPHTHRIFAALCSPTFTRETLKRVL